MPLLHPHRLLAFVLVASAILWRAQPVASANPPDNGNTALIAKPKLEEDSYDWYARHEAVLRVQDQLNPEVVMIGDSITHFWAGPPEAQRQSGLESWHQLFGKRPVLNMGFGWDRTQNVLWRLEHGEFDGLHPKWIVLNIGTNNFSETAHARANTPAEVAEAVGVLCERLHAKSPESKMIIMGVFPRGQKPDNPFRAKIAQLNQLLPRVAKSHNAIFLDIGNQFLAPDGTIPAELMSDFCHPSERGYAIWAKALKPCITETGKVVERQ
jgi:lysophospholipase L1-like esterase